MRLPVNYYNASRSPSTVHVKNTRLRRYFRKYLFQKAISVFKWNLPEKWDRDYFLYTLYGLGYIAVLDTDQYGVICQGGALGGYNLYYRPSYIIITNPLLKDTYTCSIDRRTESGANKALTSTSNKECVLIKLQPDYSSIMDIVEYKKMHQKVHSQEEYMEIPWEHLATEWAICWLYSPVNRKIAKAFEKDYFGYGKE